MTYLKYMYNANYFIFNNEEMNERRVNLFNYKIFIRRKEIIWLFFSQVSSGVGATPAAFPGDPAACCASISSSGSPPSLSSSASSASSSSLKRNN